MINQNEDLTSDDDIGDPENAVTDNALAKQFLHPGYTFKGMQLRPYTAGTDLLFNQVLDRNDAPFTIFLSFIFIHVRERKELRMLCWDKEKFREALLDWVDSIGQLSNEDKTEAMNLFEEMRGWAQKSSVEVIPDAAASQKKTKANRRRQSPA
jgi:hypothetical protein